jgi:hypothetical protein
MLFIFVGALLSYLIIEVVFFKILNLKLTFDNEMIVDFFKNSEYYQFSGEKEYYFINLNNYENSQNYCLLLNHFSIWLPYIFYGNKNNYTVFLFSKQYWQIRKYIKIQKTAYKLKNKFKIK